jgi:hypothetical protein
MFTYSLTHIHLLTKSLSYTHSFSLSLSLSLSLFLSHSHSLFQLLTLLHTHSLIYSLIYSTTYLHHDVVADGVAAEDDEEGQIDTAGHKDVAVDAEDEAGRGWRGDRGDGGAGGATVLTGAGGRGVGQASVAGRGRRVARHHGISFGVDVRPVRDVEVDLHARNKSLTILLLSLISSEYFYVFLYSHVYIIHNLPLFHKKNDNLVISKTFKERPLEERTPTQRGQFCQVPTLSGYKTFLLATSFCSSGFYLNVIGIYAK